MEAWAADAAARQTASSRRAPSPPPTRPHPFTTTAFNAKVLATRQLQQANASAKENNNHTETAMHPTDIKPPAAKVLKLTTAFGARVLATRHLQEAKAASKDAAPGQQPTGETPMRAIDKDGVIWHWTDEFGWRMLGDGEEEAAPKKVAKPKRTPAEIAMAAEARRRIMGVAPSPSRARAEYGWPEHAVALSAAARSTRGARCGTRSTIVHPVSPSTRSTSCRRKSMRGSSVSARGGCTYSCPPTPNARAPPARRSFARS